MKNRYRVQLWLQVQSLAQRLKLRKKVSMAKAREDINKPLYNSDAPLTAVMDALEVGIYVADMETYTLLFVNRHVRQELGAREGQICWQILQTGQTGPCPFCTNVHLMANGQPTGIYIWEFQNTITGRWHQLQDQAIRWMDRRWVRMEIATDITDLKHTESELRRVKEEAELANRAKSVFLANMSHELRTPLNGILGYAQILKRNTMLTEAHLHGLNVIEESGYHLLSLINDVLDLAKVEAGRIELDEVDFSLPHLIENVTDIIRVRAERKGVLFTVTQEHLPEGVHGDERRLRQILINLLDNAVKYTDVGCVELSVSRVSMPLSPCTSTLQSSPFPVMLRFSIEDTGPGLTPDDLEHIFKPFQQASRHQRQFKGTGLGLALTRNLVELMGGQLQVCSAPGAGSTFWFEICMSEVKNRNATPVPIARSIVGIQHEGPPLTILIVDDNVTHRAVIVNLLTPLGFHILEASDGRMGLVQAHTQKPDLIIVDLIMPELDGLTLIHMIRQDATLQTVPIIAMSASVYKGNDVISSSIDSNLEMGASVFLPKPLDVELFLVHVQQLLKLTWIYAPEHSSDQSVVMLSEDVGTHAEKIPSQDILLKIQNLLMTGDIEELRAYLESLVQTDAALEPFVAQLRTLSLQFNLKAMESLLAHYVHQESEKEANM
ncbi:MAG: response regulator [Anaerolineae bacterium]|nr:response regulator [Anaerolineae bacterium]